MELRELRYFLAVANEENITKAADLVHTTQPNLSRQIHSLEEEIGKPLFVRENRRISLTPAGKLLRKRAEEILELYEKTEKELTGSDKDISGDVSIGCGESYAMRLIARAAKRTRENNPKIRFHFFSGDAATVTERLDQGLFDFGVLIDYPDMSEFEYIRLPLFDEWGVLVRSDHPLASKQAVTAEDLRDIPLICSQQVMRNKAHAVANWLRRAGTAPEIAATYNLLFNASLLVREGLGCALGINRIVCADESNDLQFLPLSPPVESHLDVVRKKSRLLSPAADCFLRELTAVLQH